MEAAKLPPKFQINQYVMGFMEVPVVGPIEGVKANEKRPDIPLYSVRRMWDGQVVDIEESLLMPYDRDKFSESGTLFTQVIALREQAAAMLHKVVEMLRPGE